MYGKTVALAILAALALSGCGGGDEAAPEAEADAPQSLNDAMQAMNDAMQNAPGMGAADPDAPTFTQDELRAMMPESVDGFDRTELEVTSTAMGGMNMTTLQATYQLEDGGSVHVSVTDVGTVPGMAMASAAWTMASFDRTTQTGFERTTTWEGFQAMETQDVQGDNTRSSLSVLAGNYLAQLEGNGVDLETVKEIADEVGVADLGG